MTPKVFIIEDNSHLREALVALVGKLGGIEICGESGSGEEAFDKLEGLHPDLILVDGSLPGMSGEEFVREMRRLQPDLPCLFYSGRDEVENVRSALDAGACGYVVKDGRFNELVEAVTLSVEGACYVSPSVIGWERPATDPDQES